MDDFDDNILDKELNDEDDNSNQYESKKTLEPVKRRNTRFRYSEKKMKQLQRKVNDLPKETPYKNIAKVLGISTCIKQICEYRRVKY